MRQNNAVINSKLTKVCKNSAYRKSPTRACKYRAVMSYFYTVFKKYFNENQT